MINLVTELSKYLIIFLMAGYTYYNFRYFKLKSMKRKNRLCGKQNFIMFLIHLLSSLLMYLRTEDTKIIEFYLMQLTFLIIYQILYRLLYKGSSRLLFNNSCILLSIGFIILTRLSYDRAFRQFIIVVAAAVITLIVPYLIRKLSTLENYYWIYCGMGLLLLLVVLVLGRSSFGAQISISIAGVSIQPTEFVKICFVFFAAAMLTKSIEFKNVLVTTSLAALHVIILVLSKDLGSALILFLAYLSMLFVATGQYLYFFGGLLAGSGAAVFAYKMFSHVKVRVEVWQNPWADMYGKGYQIVQSLFAIGTGGWFGMGLYQGMPNKIPVVEKDFIFAAISEEFGGVFALCLILVCLGCFLQFLMIAIDCKVVFYKLVAFGLSIIYIVQVFLTIGGVIKFIPHTGVTLPFISYGGSSILGTFIIMGIIQGIYIMNQQEGEDDEQE